METFVTTITLLNWAKIIGVKDQGQEPQAYSAMFLRFHESPQFRCVLELD